MSKNIEINITLYSPKEIWEKFWNRFYWPRRKLCSEWMDAGEYWMHHEIITDLICNLEDYGISLDLDQTVKLEKEVNNRIKDTFDRLRKLIMKP